MNGYGVIDDPQPPPAGTPAELTSTSLLGQGCIVDAQMETHPDGRQVWLFCWLTAMHEGHHFDVVDGWWHLEDGES